MPLSKVELVEMIGKALRDELTEKEHRKLRTALCKKLNDEDNLESFKEKIILSGYALYSSNPDKRRRYINRGLEQWRQQHETS